VAGISLPYPVRGFGAVDLVRSRSSRAEEPVYVFSRRRRIEPVAPGCHPAVRRRQQRPSVDQREHRPPQGGALSGREDHSRSDRRGSVLHHNWGDIVTFQRTGNKHAGLYVAGTWISSDASWKCLKAPEYEEHDKQILGVIGDRRIRYPVIADGSKVITGNLHDPTFDDGSWKPAAVIENGPWPARPSDVETPGQREHSVRPAKVLAAGTAERTLPISDEPASMAAGIRTSKCRPEAEWTGLAGNLISGKPVTITGQAGETKYITFDFHQPIHGYPFIGLKDAPAGVKIDLGYCELSRSLCTSKLHVDETGWINPEGVVGPGYADRYIMVRSRSSFPTNALPAGCRSTSISLPTAR